jgi:hypothetical protein
MFLMWQWKHGGICWVELTMVAVSRRGGYQSVAC